MSIKLRLGFLLGSLLLAFLALLWVLRTSERHELETMLAEDRQTRAQLLDHWIDFSARTLPQFAADAAQSEEFSALLAQPDVAASRAKLAAAFAEARVSAAWLIGSDGRKRARAGEAGLASAFPLSAPDFARLVAETPSPRCFALDGAELLELCAHRRAISPSGASDWLVVARRWDEVQLRALAQLTDARVSLAGPHDASPPPASASHLVLTRVLADWEGHPLRTLRVDYEAPEFGQAVAADWRQAQVFVVFGLLVIVAVGLAL